MYNALADVKLLTSLLICNNCPPVDTGINQLKKSADSVVLKVT